MVELTQENTAEQAVAAGKIIRARELDYYDSVGQARAHAETEGIDELTFIPNIGYREYTGVPRKYPEDLEDRITSVFGRLLSGQPQTFIHSVNHRLTVGSTLPGASTDEAGAELVIAEHGRSCDIRMPLSEIIVTRMIPQVNSATRNETSQRNFKPVELRLGRTILVDYVRDAKDFETAVRDSHRPWEAVLVVGISAIHEYMSTMEAKADKYAPKGPGAVGRIEALQQMLESY